MAGVSEKTVVTYISDGTIRAEFLESLLALQQRELESKTPRLVGWVSAVSGPRICAARNLVTRRALGHPNEPEWVLMLDTDMAFWPDLLDRMFEQADPESCPILGGLCFGGDPMGGQFPTLYVLQEPDVEHEVGPIRIVHDYPENALVKVDSTGAACLLVHRTVLEKMAAEYGVVQPWFAETVYKDFFDMGEDWTFCMRAQRLGFPTHVHTGIDVGHVKPGVLDRRSHAEYLRRRDEFGADAVEVQARTARRQLG